MEIRILPDPTPELEALVETHVAFCDGSAPADSCHRLPVSELFAPDITVWGAYEDGALVSMGALKRLSATEGEVKSMHTLAAGRGRGAGRAILGTIVAAAREAGLTSLSLETGVHDQFGAAVGLYRSFGFVDCPPFGSYRHDPHSRFLTLDLTTAEVPA